MKANVFFTDGTERIVQGETLAMMATEIVDIVECCDFATVPQSVTLLNDKGDKDSELQVQWSLTLRQ